jgi:NADH oxidoreductase Hcr
VLLAAGIGITPLMSMLRHATTTEPMRPVTLLYGARSDDELAFRDELATIARRHPQVRIQLAASQPSHSPEIYPGRLDEALLRATVPDLAHAISFICGPAAMIDDMRALLADLGVPPSQVRFEVFQAAIAAAAGMGERVSGDSKHERADTYQMQCTHVRKRISIRAGQTLLDAADVAGVEMASLCRAGVCGTCRVRVAAGDVRCESTVLDAEERGQGYVLACVTTAHSDCVVDI